VTQELKNASSLYFSIGFLFEFSPRADGLKKAIILAHGYTIKIYIKRPRKENKKRRK
jgi:hypothetical protein